LVDINCPAIPETLLEAELFGYGRGAFTGAHRAKPGLFQAAHRGTRFLDEVGLLPESLQAKLLAAIEERAVRRLGSTRRVHHQRDEHRQAGQLLRRAPSVLYILA
jgi:transcriptional regulator with PAS, ATPase and Fis domain